MSKMDLILLLEDYNSLVPPIESYNHIEPTKGQIFDTYGSEVLYQDIDYEKEMIAYYEYIRNSETGRTY